MSFFSRQPSQPSIYNALKFSTNIFRRARLTWKISMTDEIENLLHLVCFFKSSDVSLTYKTRS